VRCIGCCGEWRARGLSESQWVTEGTGPAKRVYKITPEGEDLLNSWVAVLNSHKESLEQFLDVYNRKFEKEAKYT
jgi:DNA-binding PadR family transcriptional regulator